MKKLLVGMAMTTLGACAPSVLSATPRSITIEGVKTAPLNNNLAEADAMAQRHCEQYNRHAERVPDNSPDGIVLYKCVE